MKSLPEIQERMEQTERSLFTLWKDITLDELWTYFCMQLIIGVIHEPNYHLYWTKDNIFTTSIFSRFMRCDRFEQIRKMIHFTNPLKEDPTNSLSKMDTFLDALRVKFKDNYTPAKHVAVDEYLTLWKGRLKFKISFQTSAKGWHRFICCARARLAIFQISLCIVVLIPSILNHR